MEKKWYDNALMVNRDPNWYQHMDISSAEACRASIETYFSQYEGHVTDVLIGLLEQTAMVPSKAFMWRGEKYLQKEENGISVDYTERLEKLYKCFAEYHIDAVQIFIDQIRKLGIRPWITLRMNDAHFGSDPTSFLRSDLYYRAQAEGGMIGSEYGYYAHVFNFRYEPYRKALLGYIAELLEKYDIFGFEMDFMREIHCFDYKHDTGIQEVMLDFVREVRALTDAAGKRLGHDVKVSIRTNRSVQDTYEFGFDIKSMVEEGLVDLVVPSARWSPTDSAIPIAEWKALFGDKVGIIAGLETNNVKSATMFAKHTKAHVAAYFSQGADGFYLNNHEYYTDRNRETWTISRDNCFECYREFVVTCQDCFADPNRRYKPLPLTVDGCAELPLGVGKLKSNDSVTVVIDFDGDAMPTLQIGEQIYVGKAVAALEERRGDRSICFTDHQPIAFDIGGVETENDLLLSFVGNGTVFYVCLQIDAK